MIRAGEEAAREMHENGTGTRIRGRITEGRTIHMTG
jgi:hypothetical protein